MFTRREVLKVAAGGVAMAMGGRVRAAGESGGVGVQNVGAVWAYVGGYGNGIRLFRLDLGTGELRDVGVAGEVVRPSFFRIAPSGKFLYSVCTVMVEGKKVYRLGAFAVDGGAGGTGKLTHWNDRACGGDNGCYVAIDGAGRNALVANYDSATVASLPIDGEGRLGEAVSVMKQEGSGPVAGRQGHSYPHSINFSPDGRFAFAPDLGADRIYVYRFDGAKGMLAAADPETIVRPAGSGPRHMAFHPDGKLVYLISELASTLTAFAYDAAGGKLSELQTISTLPPDYTGAAQAAEVQVHPSGKFLICSNRGPDNVTSFAIDAGSGKLTRIASHTTLGNWPRYCWMEPTGNYLIVGNQRSDSIVLFRIGADGSMEVVGEPVKVMQPSCVQFLAVT